jgi:hypothetical protein
MLLREERDALERAMGTTEIISRKSQFKREEIPHRTDRRVTLYILEHGTATEGDEVSPTPTPYN